MGLPRYLKDKENEWIEFINKNDTMPMELYWMMEDYFRIRKIIYYGHLENHLYMHNNLLVRAGAKISKEKKASFNTQDFIRHAIKCKYNLYQNSEIESGETCIFIFSKFRIKKYLKGDYLIKNNLYELDHIGEKFEDDMYSMIQSDVEVYQCLFKKVWVKECYYNHYIKMSAKAYMKHLNELKKYGYDHYVYKYYKTFNSRCYPATLRQLIFERDNYTCQCCGITKENAMEKGIHLEVDHIIEWEDGGETTYENGQTLCSRCNKAKHRVKRLKTA